MGCKSMCLRGLSLLVFVVAIEGSYLSAQTGNAESLSASIEDLQYLAAGENIRLSNRFTEDCYIESLSFHVADFVVDARPKLTYQIFPFLDTIVIQVSNVGWGRFQGGSLTIFGENDGIDVAKGPQNVVTRKLIDLFDLDSSSRRLATIDTTTFILWRVGPNASPFRYRTTGKFNLAGMQRPAIPIVRGKIGTSDAYQVDMTTNNAVLVPMNYNIEGRERAFSGHTTFGGLITQTGMPTETIAYYGRRVPPVDLTNRERSLARQLNIAEFQGGLSTLWGFVFGDRDLVAEMRTRTVAATHVIGVTVDVGEGLERQLSAPVGAVIEPNGNIEFPLTILASKSATVKLNVECVYHYGNSPPRSFVLKRDLVKSVRAPRTTDLSDLSTERLLSNLRTVDAELEERGSILLSEFVAKADERENMLSNPLSLRQIRDALSLASCTEDAQLKRLGHLVIELVVADHSRVDPGEFATLAYQSLFPLICAFDPKIAVDLAVRDYTLDTRTYPSLVTRSICFEATHQHLRTHSTRLTELLSANQQWNEDDIALAAVLRHPKCASTIVERLQQEWADHGPLRLYVWASMQLNSPQLDAAIGSIVKSQTPSNRAVKEVVEALLEFERSGFEDDVVQVIGKIKDKGNYIESLIACLDYLQRYRSANAEQVLQELRIYPMRSEVRDRARSMLGE